MNPVKLLFSRGEFRAEINKHPASKNSFNTTGNWITWDEICKCLHENLANEEKAVTAICDWFLVISLSWRRKPSVHYTDKLPSLISVNINCMIPGFHHEADVNCVLLGYYRARSGNISKEIQIHTAATQKIAVLKILIVQQYQIFKV